MNTAPLRALLQPTLITAISCAVAGWAALVLAIPPGFASPLYPAAGIALVMTVVHGWSALPGVVLGSFLANIATSAQHGPGHWIGWIAPLGIGLGSAAQAAVGAALVRRFVSQPLTLSEPRDVTRFFVFGAFLACFISSLIGNASLWLNGTVPTSRLLSNFATWWIGDTLGVLIAAPVTLTFIGRPREDWEHRRATVGLSFAVVTVLLALAIVHVSRWNEQRARAIFERDAANATHALIVGLNEPLYALEAMRGAFLVSEHITAEQMRLVAQPWLTQPLHLQAIAWSVRVPRSEAEALQRQARAQDAPDFRIFDRPDGAGLALGDADMVILRYIEPRADNAAALGLNLLSIPAARQAVEAAMLSDEPVASAGFRLTQETGNDVGVVVYRPIYTQTPGPHDAADRPLRGVVSVVLRMDEVMQSVMAQYPPYLRWCLLETGGAEQPRRLAGSPGCETAALGALMKRQQIAFAGRQWEVRVGTDLTAVPASDQWTIWIFSLVGLAAAAILGALLLTVTGRTRRIKVAVEDRTAALQREVQERQRTEVALRESERRFRNIFDHVPIGVFYCDLRGTIRESNPKFRQLTGFTSEELGRMTSLDLTHPDDRADDVELSQRLITGEIQMYRRQKRYVVKSGRTLWIQTTVTVLRDFNGLPQRLVGVIEDITEHLKLEEAEHARESAEAANRAKSDFLSRMSHELRTPLNAMLGFAQLLELDQARPLSAKQLEWTGQIRRAGWHLLHMINDTLDLSRIESGTLKLDVAEIDLEEVVNSTRALVEQAAAQRGIIITQSLDPDALVALGDVTRVKQILTNLMSNAVKYNTEHGYLHLAVARRDPQMVEIAVTDTGLGLNSQQMSELFQPFNRLGREKSGVEGTGIGLVISQRLAELMGGSLHAHSIVGEGSTFILTLPRGTREVHHAETRSGADDLSADYRNRLVHYIEDNETNAEVMRGILAQRPQVTLVVSGTGAEALEFLRTSRRPDLILLDMHLPDVDGLDLLKQIKGNPDTADVPVVVVSADAMVTRMDTAIRAGAIHYLTKPVNVAELLTVLDEVLEQADTMFG